MSITVEAPAIAEAAPPRHSRRRLWSILAAVAVVLVGGAIATTVVALRYAHAKTLENAGAFEWSRADNAHQHDDTAGPWTALRVPARPGHVQTFYVLIDNPSDVTQTILGLPSYYSGHIAEPAELAVARPRATTFLDQEEPNYQRFTSASAVLPPGAIRWLRFSIHTTTDGDWSPGTRRTRWWSELTLRVRVGIFTRTETVDFGHLLFELSSP